jgi:hypothetical protein
VRVLAPKRHEGVGMRRPDRGDGVPAPPCILRMWSLTTRARQIHAPLVQKRPEKSDGRRALCLRPTRTIAGATEPASHKAG